MRKMRVRSSEAGFNLVELLMCVALLGVGFGIISTMFIQGWNLYKKSYTELILQKKSRETMAVIAMALREASPGSVRISTPAGSPQYSRIDFMDARGRGWVFRMSGDTVERIAPMADGTSATLFMMRKVTSLSFVYPSFQDLTLIDVALTAQERPYVRSEMAVVQVVERIILRNP